MNKKGEPPPSSPKPAPNKRWVGVTLAALASALFTASFFQPWWSFVLYAPQYPSGLSLLISLTGPSGDVREVNMLNHYIGMASLDEAAVIESQLAGWGIGVLCITVLTLAFLGRRRMAWIGAALGMALPVGFIADTSFWMYHFGHTLDPRAPLRIQSFTPQLFGNGVIGQFMTFAVPARGFWLALAGAVLLLIGAVIVSRRPRPA